MANTRKYEPDTVTNGGARVIYPQKPSEFDIQAGLYNLVDRLCQDLDNGTEVKSEVTAICNGERSRFDLMVFKWNGDREAHPICGIEVKCNGWGSSQREVQQHKYREFTAASGIPVVYCIGAEGIDRAINEIEDHIA